MSGRNYKLHHRSRFKNVVGRLGAEHDSYGEWAYWCPVKSQWLPVPCSCPEVAQRARYFKYLGTRRGVDRVMRVPLGYATPANTREWVETDEADWRKFVEEILACWTA